MSLPPSWRPIVSGLSDADYNDTNVIRQQLRNEGFRLKAEREKVLQVKTALAMMNITPAASQTNDKKDMKGNEGPATGKRKFSSLKFNPHIMCHYCSKTGHIKPHCWACKKAKASNSNSNSNSNNSDVPKANFFAFTANTQDELHLPSH